MSLLCSFAHTSAVAPRTRRFVKLLTNCRHGAAKDLTPPITELSDDCDGAGTKAGWTRGRPVREESVRGSSAAVGLAGGSLRAVPIASSALATTCAARARLMSSAALASSSSACARMMPSWLFRRWNRTRRSHRPGAPSPRRSRTAGAGSRVRSDVGCTSRCTGARSAQPCGSRHSVSAKIRTAPPAVRTYSTLPAEIQL